MRTANILNRKKREAEAAARAYAGTVAEVEQRVRELEEALRTSEHWSGDDLRRSLWIAPNEDTWAARAIEQSTPARFGLVIGAEKLEAIARAAGLDPRVPVVRSIVDPAFVQLMTGTRDPAAVMGWYSAVAAALGVNIRDLRDPLRRESFIWTASEFLAALEEAAIRKQAHAETALASRKRARC